MNTKLLRRIQKKILAEPKQFQMLYWFRNQYERGVEIPNCGTAACIAGWCYALQLGENPAKAQRRYNRLKGKVLQPRGLELSHQQKKRLFYMDNWPLKYRPARFWRYGIPSAQYTLGFARNAVRRIDHFIKTKGAE